MALTENLDSLDMTMLETLLKQCLAVRPDVADHIPSSAEMSEYVTWLVKTYGRQHGKVTQMSLSWQTRSQRLWICRRKQMCRPANF